MQKLKQKLSEKLHPHPHQHPPAALPNQVSISTATPEQEIYRYRKQRGKQDPGLYKNAGSATRPTAVPLHRPKATSTSPMEPTPKRSSNLTGTNGFKRTIGGGYPNMGLIPSAYRTGDADEREVHVLSSRLGITTFVESTLPSWMGLIFKDVRIHSPVRGTGSRVPLKVRIGMDSVCS
ncbi:hypothetical protein AX17_006544 [Amanita inopinata Kibby_2008]|nr:hypothetical protein AX17_006544 [Amanita inopinata Kibby_2008]